MKWGMITSTPNTIPRFHDFSVTDGVFHFGNHPATGGIPLWLQYVHHHYLGPFQHGLRLCWASTKRSSSQPHCGVKNSSSANNWKQKQVEFWNCLLCTYSYIWIINVNGQLRANMWLQPTTIPWYSWMQSHAPTHSTSWICAPSEKMLNMRSMMGFKHCFNKWVNLGCTNRGLGYPDTTSQSIVVETCWNQMYLMCHPSRRNGTIRKPCETKGKSTLW